MSVKCKACNHVIKDATALKCDVCGSYPPFILVDRVYIGEATTDKPKDRVGKFIPHLLCGSIIEAITRVREYGVKKYSGENGWKQQTMLDYMDAIGRHYSACLNDPMSRDSESGLLHISHIATDAMFVIQFLVDSGVDISTMKEPPKL